jgi:tetratricopeptide (TPR) repeat protein
MDGLKTPIILLIIVLVAGIFLFNPFASRPTRDRPDKPGDDSQTEVPSASRETLIEDAKKAFARNDFQKTVTLLNKFRKENDYEIQRMLGYSYAGLKMFDPAIVAFEKTLEKRKVPENGFSLAYLYEITGRLKVARLLYEDLLNAKLPPKMLKAVYEGLSRTSVYENNTKAAFQYNMEMVKRYPESPEGFVALIKILKNIGSLKGIENLVARGDKFQKNNFEYNFWLGVLYFEAGKFDKALKRFRTCIKIDPKNSTPYYYSYRILKRQKNIETALKDLEKYHKLNPMLPHIFFEAAIDAKNEGRLDLTYKFLRSAYTLDRTLLGRDDKGAMRAVEKMINQKGRKLDKQFMTAFINYINGDYKVARDQIRHLLPRIKGTDMETDAMRILRECDLLDKQERDYKGYMAGIQRQRLLEQQALMQSAAANAQKEFSNETEAEIIMKKAMINPNDLHMQYYAGLQLAKLGAIEDAKRFFQNALRLNPNVLEVNYSMAKVLIFQNQNLQAREYIDRALKVHPNNSQTLSLSASLHFKERDYSRAKSDAEAALKSNPNNGEARLVLAEVAMKQNNFRQALKEVEKGLRIEKNPERRQKLLNIKNSLPY